MTINFLKNPGVTGISFLQSLVNFFFWNVLCSILFHINPANKLFSHCEKFLLLVISLHQMFLVKINFSFRSFSYIFHIIFIHFIVKTTLLLWNNITLYRERFCSMSNLLTINFIRYTCYMKSFCYMC